MFHPRDASGTNVFFDSVNANPFLNQRDWMNHEIDCETFVEIIF